MAQTFLYGSLIQSGSIPATALGGGVLSSSAQLPTGTVSSSAQEVANIAGQVISPASVSASANISASKGLFSTNVGIGTLSPAYALDVSGDLGFANTNVIRWKDSGGTARRIAQVSSTNYVFLGDIDYAMLGETHMRASSSVVFGVNNSERMRIDSSGNVGIGNTPSYKLDVNGTIGLASYPFAVHTGNYNAIYEPAGNVAIYLGNASDPTNYYDNTSHWWRGRGSSGTLMFLNSTGLGIGTSGPSGLLHVYGSNNTAAINVADSTAVKADSTVKVDSTVKADSAVTK